MQPGDNAVSVRTRHLWASRFTKASLTEIKHYDEWRGKRLKQGASRTTLCALSLTHARCDKNSVGHLMTRCQLRWSGGVYFKNTR